MARDGRHELWPALSVEPPERLNHPTLGREVPSGAVGAPRDGSAQGDHVYLPLAPFFVLLPLGVEAVEGEEHISRGRRRRGRPTFGWNLEGHREHATLSGAHPEPRTGPLPQPLGCLGRWQLDASIRAGH